MCYFHFFLHPSAWFTESFQTPSRSFPNRTICLYLPLPSVTFLRLFPTSSLFAYILAGSLGILNRLSLSYPIPQVKSSFPSPYHCKNCHFGYVQPSPSPIPTKQYIFWVYNAQIPMQYPNHVFLPFLQASKTLFNLFCGYGKTNTALYTQTRVFILILFFFYLLLGHRLI